MKITISYVPSTGNMLVVGTEQIAGNVITRYAEEHRPEETILSVLNKVRLECDMPPVKLPFGK